MLKINIVGKWQGEPFTRINWKMESHLWMAVFFAFFDIFYFTEKN